MFNTARFADLVPGERYTWTVAMHEQHAASFIRELERRKIKWSQRRAPAGSAAFRLKATVQEMELFYQFYVIDDCSVDRELVFSVT